MSGRAVGIASRLEFENSPLHSLARIQAGAVVRTVRGARRLREQASVEAALVSVAEDLQVGVYLAEG